jgi:hypothetical protein
VSSLRSSSSILLLVFGKYSVESNHPDRVANQRLLNRQEFNAEKTMDSLKNLSSPTASVERNSENITIATAEIVPGDMVELKTGDTVPADLRFAVLSLDSHTICTNTR